MNRNDPFNTLRKAQTRSRQALNAKKVLDREFAKLPLAQRRRIVNLKHRGFTAQDLADHDFDYAIGGSSDLSLPEVGDSSVWDTDSPSVSSWETIDLTSQAPSDYYPAGQLPRWNLSRIASGADEAFSAEVVAEEAGIATSEFGPEIAIPIAGLVYGSIQLVRAAEKHFHPPTQQVYPAPPQAGGFPQGWEQFNHGNTQQQ